MNKEFLLNRFGRTLLTLVGVSIIAFMILHLAPGDPARIMLGQFATEENIEIFREQHHLNEPLPVQYGAWIRGVIQGDFGYSIRYNRPVHELIWTRMWPTLTLTVSALVLAVILGFTLGILAAIKRNSWLDYITTIQAMFWISIPAFWLGILFLYFFGLRLRWFPIGGMAGVASLVLPVLALGLREEAWFARPMRSEMLEVLSQAYIRSARARGIKERVIIARHALRNALIPLVTMIALRLPWIIGGSVVIEVVFAWGGMGSLLVNSVLSRDFPVVQAILLLISFAVVMANLFADLLYSVIDPRIRLED